MQRRRQPRDLQQLHGDRERAVGVDRWLPGADGSGWLEDGHARYIHVRPVALRDRINLGCRPHDDVHLDVHIHLDLNEHLIVKLVVLVNVVIVLDVHQHEHQHQHLNEHFDIDLFLDVELNLFVVVILLDVNLHIHVIIDVVLNLHLDLFDHDRADIHHQLVEHVIIDIDLNVVHLVVELVFIVILFNLQLVFNDELFDHLDLDLIKHEQLIFDEHVFDDHDPRRYTDTEGVSRRFLIICLLLSAQRGQDRQVAAAPSPGHTISRGHSGFWLSACTS